MNKCNLPFFSFLRFHSLILVPIKNQFRPSPNRLCAIPAVSSEIQSRGRDGVGGGEGERKREDEGQRSDDRSDETAELNGFMFALSPLQPLLLLLFDSFDSRRAPHQYVRCHSPTDL